MSDGAERGTSEVEPTAPSLGIVQGTPTPEEVAALVAVLAAMAATGSERPARRTSAWAAPARQVREKFPHGAGGWRASGLPR